MNIFLRIKEKIQKMKAERVVRLSIEKIVSSPYQPRRVGDEEAIRRLCASISRFGLLQPLLVRKIRGGKYEILSGERRLCALKKLRVQKAPVRICAVSEKEAEALILSERVQGLALTEEERRSAYEKITRKSDENPAEWGVPCTFVMNKEELEKRFFAQGEGALRAQKSDCRIRPFTPRPSSARTVYGNTIKKTVGMLNLAGAKAQSREVEEKTCTKYIISIPKSE